MKSILFTHFKEKLLDGSKFQTYRCIYVPTYDINEIVSKIIWYFIEEDGISRFTFDCEKCGEEWWLDIPDKKDLYNWKRKNRPLKDKCNACNHINKINPRTLLLIEE